MEKVAEPIMEQAVEQRRHYLNTHIAGFGYWDGCIVLDQLKRGLELKLVREKNNGFDPYAVALYFGENKLGFIPRGENHEISKFIEMGHAAIFEARINRLSLDKEPENQVGIIVYIKRRG